ncbi:MAG: hypothetical protein U0168_06460 [Nannocystaceae bacterium]
MRIDVQRGSERHLRSFDHLGVLPIGGGQERILAPAPRSRSPRRAGRPTAHDRLARSERDRVGLWVASRDDGVAPRRLLDVVDLIAGVPWLGPDALVVLADDRGGPPPRRRRCRPGR